MKSSETHSKKRRIDYDSYEQNKKQKLEESKFYKKQKILERNCKLIDIFIIGYLDESQECFTEKQIEEIQMNALEQTNTQEAAETLIDLTKSDEEPPTSPVQPEEEEEMDLNTELKLLESCFGENELQDLWEEWYENHKYEDDNDAAVIEWRKKYPGFNDYLKKIISNRLKCKNLEALLKNRYSLVRKIMKGKYKDNE